MRMLLGLALLASVLLSGCTIKSEEENDKAVEKIDDEKEFVYAEIIEDGHYAPVIEIGYPSSILLDRVDNQIERIVLNFESQDAELVQARLDETKNQQLEYHGKVISTFILYDFVETEDTISLIAYANRYKLDSDGFVDNIYTYVFDKTTGNLLTDEEILALVELDIDQIVRLMKDIQSANEDESMKGRIDYQISQESCSTDESMYDMCESLVANNRFFVTAQKHLVVALEKTWIKTDVLDPEAVYYTLLEITSADR